MCGACPNSTTDGKPPPRMTLLEAIVEIFSGRRWYDAPVSRPHRGGEVK